MKYIRMHQVEAEPMTHGEFMKAMGKTDEMMSEQGAKAEGYLVVYPDGYKSWCPKAQFEAAAICADRGLPFGYAIAQCRYNGKKVKRAGWNGVDQYVECCTCTVESKSGHYTSEAFVFHGKNIHTGETNVQVGWLASQADLKADDWQIVE